ncbi:hypothetical protein GPECTOR_13g628 [Gonium pectorale]|uniref:BTB domain-containing protein n=1 Tax=Gonium pectorale TaxID=33097 RepID=A0A150GMX3_GONPE|nr:hypothetical protein GPECTOR_13g628 [Gonium pectorale]|eukprot:KXZ51141.1 hypothetical protein GPECTOR_13g628 [Gonium pectorale]
MNVDDGTLEPYELDEEDELRRATCDPVTGIVYICTLSVLFQVDIAGGNVAVLSRLAGSPGDEEEVDGPGDAARVDRPFCILADGCGSLLIKDCGSSSVRRVLLPPPGSPPNTPSPAVSTLPHEYPNNIWGLALDYSEPQRLYVATKTAIYRHDELPYDASPAGAAAAAAGGAAGGAGEQPARRTAPVLLAGLEGDVSQLDGMTAISNDKDGAAGRGGTVSRGGSGTAVSSARFRHINAMQVDSRGRIFVVERAGDEASIRVVSPCGLVTSFLAGFDVAGSEYQICILPYGWLCVCAWDEARVHMLQLGPRIAPSEPAPRGTAADGLAGGGGGGGLLPPAPGRPGLAGLAADLGALLDGPPEVAAPDVDVLVGGRAFPCHRALLGARCEYFRGRFASGLADSAGSEIALPDADPDAFALLRRYLYTSSLDIPPSLLRPTLELADRLLLPAAAVVATQQLLTAVTPGSVVADLLWAEARGFASLLAGLKAYYLDHAHAVLEEAPASLEQLMTSSPKLHLELYAAGIKRARRR